MIKISEEIKRELSRAQKEVEECTNKEFSFYLGKVTALQLVLTLVTIAELKNEKETNI
jgi:hypothetical protein